MIEACLQTPVSAGTRMIVITCPVLGREVLVYWKGQDGLEELYRELAFMQVMDRMNANPEHGAWTGRLVECVDTHTPFGIYPAQVVLEDLYHETGAALDKAGDGKKVRRSLQSADCGLQAMILQGLADALEEGGDASGERPCRWMQYVPMPDEVFLAVEMTRSKWTGQAAKLLMTMGEVGDQASASGEEIDAEEFWARVEKGVTSDAEEYDPDKAVPLCLALPDTEENRSLVNHLWSAVLDRVSAMPLDHGGF